MRIVIAALTAPSKLNGVSRHAANLMRGLLSLPAPLELHFIAGAWQKQMYSQSTPPADARIYFHWVPIRNTNFNRVRWYYWELPHVAAQLEADLVHYACPVPVRTGACRCPTVVSLHDLYPFDIPANFGRVKGAINRQIMRQCLKSVDAIACVSATTRHQLEMWLGPEIGKRADTIFNAVEPVLTVSPRAPLLLREGQPFLLCIAQHRQNKNIPLALSIFQQAIRVGALSHETKLLIVGITGPMTPEIQKHIRELKIERHVVLLSGLSDAELQWCYRRCVLLLAPSQIEGFGLPVAEALLAGCPVVCSDIPAFREIGGDRCRYINFGEGLMQAYTSAIQEALFQPRIPASMPELSLGSIAKKYLVLYRRLLGYTDASQYGMLRHPGSKTTKSTVLKSPSPDSGNVTGLSFLRRNNCI